MIKCKEMGNVIDLTVTINEAEKQLIEAKAKQIEFKTKAQEYREAELLDYYKGEIDEGDIPEIKETRRKVLKVVRNKLSYNKTFDYLMKRLRKPKNSLLKLRISDSRSAELRTIYNRE